jgi:hypothetical protein
MRFYIIQPQYDEDLQTANFRPIATTRRRARLYRPAKAAAGNRVAVDIPTGQTLPAGYIGRIVPNSGKLLNAWYRRGQASRRAKNRGIHIAPASASPTT